MKKLIINIMLLLIMAAWLLFGWVPLLFLLLSGKSRQNAFHAVSRKWAQTLLATAGIKVHSEGLKNILAEGPKIIISNHQGNFDIPILLSVLPVNAVFLAKRELYLLPLFGWYMRGRRDIMVDRRGGKNAQKLLTDVKESVKNGDVVLIFPEGTRSKDGNVGPFKRGSVVFASNSGAKLVPVGISGSYSIQPRGTLLVSPADVYINVGEPVSITYDPEDYEESVQASESLRAKVISLIAKTPK